MTMLKPGDIVTCRIKDSRIVSCYSSYDDELSFEIIANETQGYYIYIPGSYNLQETAIVTSFISQSLNIDKKYIGGQTIYINNNYIIDILYKFTGCCCSRCGEYFPQAEANQDDGTMKCYLCRKYPFR